MNNIKVSAPGKLMLFGEHGVVYNHPCIVTAVDQRITLLAEKLNSSEFILDAKDVGVENYKKSLINLGKGDIPKGAKFVEIAVKNVKEKYSVESGLKITTNSEFSSEFGFGSSSAVSVCTIKAVTALLELSLSQKELFDLSYKTILDIQGKGSGFDIAAAVYGGTIYFLTGGKIIESLNLDEIPLVVGYSGKKADTVELINKVEEKFKNNSSKLEEIFNDIEIITNKAKQCLIKNDFENLGNLMNDNQKLLVQLGVSTEKLDEIINAANSAGAFGAKLSGAGGGDSMIALCPQVKKVAVEKAIENIGGKIIKVKTNAEGVRIEK